MRSDAKLIKHNEKSSIYQIASVERLNGKVVDSLPWGKEMAGLIFRLESDSGSEYDSLRKNIPDKYCAILSYSIPAKELLIPGGRLKKSPVKIEKVINHAKLREIFIETYSRLFLAPWAGRIGYETFSGAGRYIQNRLPESTGVCVTIRGKRVGGMITAVIAKDDDGKPTDRIGWVWVDERLTKIERKAVHRKLCEYLGSLKTGRIQCFIDSFNLRSQRFFRNLGFTAKEVIITKK